MLGGRYRKEETCHVISGFKRGTKVSKLKLRCNIVRQSVCWKQSIICEHVDQLVTISEINYNVSNDMIDINLWFRPELNFTMYMMEHTCTVLSVVPPVRVPNTLLRGNMNLFPFITCELYIQPFQAVSILQSGAQLPIRQHVVRDSSVV